MLAFAATAELIDHVKATCEMTVWHAREGR